MSPTTGWHVDDVAARRYVDRALDPTDAASVDAHLLHCEPCRAAVSAAMGDGVLDVVWHKVDVALDRPRLGLLERLLVALGMSGSTARMVAATSRSRWSYLVAVASSFALALLASRPGAEDAFGLFLVVAPLGPLVATATAFGRWADPAYELLGTVPSSPLRLLLVRAVAAVAPALALTALSSLWLVDHGWLAVTWLVPSLALSTAALALSRWVAVEVAATVLGAVWLMAPALLRLRSDDLLGLLSGPGQVASAAVVALAALAFVADRHGLDRGRA
jgi:hypothetical protein